LTAEFPAFEEQPPVAGGALTRARSRLSGGAGGALVRDDEFQAFAAAFLPTLLKGAYLLLRDIDLAEDAVQGTLLRVFRNWPEARSAPEAYSRVTLVNVCRDHWRRLRARPREVLADDLEQTASEPEREETFGDAWADRKALEGALSGLGSPQREVLILRFFLQLSVSETASALGIAEGTVKSATHRGLQQLRGVLDAGQGGEPT
jgi:RNA polymerase sigma factor (sigma-70 family)